MPEVTIALIVSAFIAGLLMFLAPCTLPLVPAYLAFISGVSVGDVDRTARRKIILNAITFVIGFTLIFTVFGMLAGFFGTFIGSFRGVLTQFGGLFIVFFGLMMLNVIRIDFLLKNYKIQPPSFVSVGNPFSSFLIGSFFALGWTPCVGPVLASILFLATTTSTVFSGGFLLLVFSLGLAVPFLVVATIYARSTNLISKYSYVSKWISYIGGVFLIFLGVLLLTDNFGLTIEYGYRIFYYFGFEGLFNHY